MGDITPVSLFAHMIETRAVPGRIAPSSSAMSRLPCLSTPRNVTSHPRFARSWQGRRTALCSTALVTKCCPPRIGPVPDLPRASNCSAKLITALLDSVPPLVKTISVGSHPRNAANRSRARLMAFLRRGCEAVSARRVAVILGQKRQHFLDDRRIKLGGRVVI